MALKRINKELKDLGTYVFSFSFFISSSSLSRLVPSSGGGGDTFITRCRRLQPKAAVV